MEMEIYEGSFKNGIPHGQGTKYWPTGEVYVGSFLNGVENGYGKVYKNNQIEFEGTFKNGQPVTKQN